MMQAQDDLVEALEAALCTQQHQNAVLSLLQLQQPSLPAVQRPVAPPPNLELVSALLQGQNLLNIALPSPASPLLSLPSPAPVFPQPQVLPSTQANALALASVLNALQAPPAPPPPRAPVQSALNLRDVLCALGRKPDNYIDVLGLPGIKQVGPRSNNDYSFPFRLHALLSNLPPELEKIIGFCAHGRALIVLDRYQVVDKVLKRHFNQSKLPSFHRQLGIWGFRRISSNDVDDGAYYHPLFLRGHKHLCSYMTRSGLKRQQQQQQSAVPPTTPNFAIMQKV